MILAAPAAAQSHLDQTVEREPCATSVHPAVLIKHYGRPERMHAKEDLQPCASGRPAWWRNIARPRQSPAISKLPHNSPELHRIHIAVVDKQLIHRYRVIRYLKPGSRRLLIFVYRHRVVTSEALGPDSVLVIRRSMRESLREEVSL